MIERSSRNKLMGISHTDDEPTVGADLSRLYLSPRQDSADLSALIHINLSKSSSLSVGARAVRCGRVGLYGRPRAHSLSPLPARPYGQYRSNKHGWTPAPPK